jgi:hypothetical protein
MESTCEQIHVLWIVILVIKLFIRMPLTPITSVLFDVPYVKTQYPVLAQSLKKKNVATKSDQCSDYKGKWTLLHSLLDY